MIAVDLSILNDSATPALREQLRKADPHVVSTYVAVKTAALWRDQLRAQPRNKNNWPSTGFWESAARSVVGVAVGGNALITADKLGLRQRLYGGTIAARNVKYLTIPICAEAYGTTAASWGDNLVLVILADGRKFLALWLGSNQAQTAYTAAKLDKLTKRAETTAARADRFRFIAGGSASESGKPNVIVFRGKGTGTGAAQATRAQKYANLKFLFVLKSSVEQTGNPNVLPPNLQEKVLEFTKEALN